MYHTGGRTGAGMGAAGAAAGSTGAGLAFTGFPVVGVTILALLIIIVGLVLVRLAMLRHTAVEAGDDDHSHDGGDDHRGPPAGGSGGGFAGPRRPRRVGWAHARSRTPRLEWAQVRARLRQPVVRRVAAVTVLMGAIALLFGESHVRLGEAILAADLLRWLHIAHATPNGSSVIFMHGQRWIGFTVATSCTAALLIAPFYIVGSALLVPSRLPVRRVVLALLAATLIVWVANQVRLLLIGASMAVWGFQSGYSRSHILAGGIVSTLGLAIGIAVYVGLLLHQRPGSTNGPLAASPQGGTR